MRYKTKPCEIEAIEFEDDSADTITAIQNFMSKELFVSYADPEHPVIKIATLEGVMDASIGDFIIKGLRGEFYPCKPDVFHKKYEVVIG